MIEIGSATVKLGETEYTIQEAGFLRAKPWKKRLLEELSPLITRATSANDIRFESAADLAQLMPLAEELLVDSPEILLDLLLAYSPVLEAARADIEAHATDRQILAAFQEVIKLADFLGLTGQLNRKIGRVMTGTLSNSQSVNGVSPTPTL